MDNKCIEIVRWQGKKNITDQQMTTAVNLILDDLNNCPGFISQLLCKNAQGQWVDIYQWENEEYAHASNQFMANKSAFIALMELIEVSSVSIEIMNTAI